MTTIFMILFVLLFVAGLIQRNMIRLLKERVEYMNDKFNFTLIEFSNIQSQFEQMDKTLSSQIIEGMNIQSKISDAFKSIHYLNDMIEENSNELDTSLSHIENRIRQAEELFVHLSLDSISIVDFKERVKLIYANHAGEDQQAFGMESPLETRNPIQDETPTSGGGVSPTIAETKETDPTRI